MLIRQTLRYAPAQFFGPLAQFVSFVLWTHMLGPAEYGQIMLIVATQELGFQLGLWWWTSYTVRYLSTMEDKRAYQSCENAILVITALVQLPIAFVTLAWIGHACDVVLFATTALYFVTRTGLNHLAERGRAVGDIISYTVAQAVSPIVGLVVGLALMRIMPAPVAVTFGFAVVQVSLLPPLILRLGLNVRPLLRLDPDHLRAALRYGGPLLIAGGLGWVTLNGIRLVVGHQEGEAALGLLSVGWSLGQRLIGVLAMLLSAAAFPLAVRSYEERGLRASLAQLSLNGALLIGLLIPAALGTMAVAAPLANNLVGLDFQAATLVVLPIAALAAAVRNIRLHFVDQVYLIMGRTKFLLGLHMLESGSTLAFCSIGLAWGGLAGACLGCLAASVITGIVSFTVALLRYRLVVPLGTLGRIALASGAMIVAVRAEVFPATTWGLAAQVGAGAVVYGAATLLLFRDVMMRPWTQPR